MDENIDIYGDLDVDEFYEEKNRERENSKIVELECEIKKNSEDIGKLKKDNERLNKKVKIMETNFNNLLDVVKNELSRKDKVIDTLRKEKDNLLFRRNLENRTNGNDFNPFSNQKDSIDAKDYKKKNSRDDRRDLSRNSRDVVKKEPRSGSTIDVYRSDSLDEAYKNRKRNYHRRRSRSRDKRKSKSPRSRSRSRDKRKSKSPRSRSIEKRYSDDKHKHRLKNDDTAALLEEQRQRILDQLNYSKRTVLWESPKKKSLPTILSNIRPEIEAVKIENLTPPQFDVFTEVPLENVPIKPKLEIDVTELELNNNISVEQDSTEKLAQYENKNGGIILDFEKRISKKDPSLKKPVTIVKAKETLIDVCRESYISSTHYKPNKKSISERSEKAIKEKPNTFELLQENCKSAPSNEIVINKEKVLTENESQSLKTHISCVKYSSEDKTIDKASKEFKSQESKKKINLNKAQTVDKSRELDSSDLLVSEDFKKEIKNKSDLNYNHIAQMQENLRVSRREDKRHSRKAPSSIFIRSDEIYKNKEIEDYDHKTTVNAKDPVTEKTGTLENNLMKPKIKHVQIGCDEIETEESEVIETEIVTTEILLSSGLMPKKRKLDKDSEENFPKQSKMDVVEELNEVPLTLICNEELFSSSEPTVLTKKPEITEEKRIKTNLNYVNGSKELDENIRMVSPSPNQNEANSSYLISDTLMKDLELSNITTDMSSFLENSVSLSNVSMSRTNTKNISTSSREYIIEAVDEYVTNVTIFRKKRKGKKNSKK